MFTEKIEKIWEDNKEVICIIGGVCLMFASSKYLKHIKKLNTLNRSIKNGTVTAMTRAISPMFPDDMPISEIKAALDKIEGALYSDALLALVDGKKTLYIR